MPGLFGIPPITGIQPQLDESAGFPMGLPIIRQREQKPKPNRYAQLAGDALQGLGLALLSDNGNGPNFGTGLALTGQLGQQRREFERQEAQDERQNRVLDLQYDKYAKEQQQQQREQAALEKAIENLPEDQKAIARANPKAVLDQIAKGFGPQETLPIEKALRAAGIQPGTPQYQNALNSYIQKETTREGAAPLQIERELMLAGIDPRSPEGRAIITKKLAGNDGITVYDPQTGQPIVQLGGSGSGKPLTEAQGRGTAQGSRAVNAYRNVEDSIDKLGPEKATSFLYNQGQKVPVLGNYITAESPEFQKLQQGILEFGLATNRLDSGATILDSEFQRFAKTYFPQPGDTKEVLAQKKNSRRVLAESILPQAGPGQGAILNIVNSSNPSLLQPGQGKQPNIVNADELEGLGFK